MGRFGSNDLDMFNKDDISKFSGVNQSLINMFYSTSTETYKCSSCHKTVSDVTCKRLLSFEIGYYEKGDICDIINKLRDHTTDLDEHYINRECDHPVKYLCTKTECIVEWPEIFVVNILDIPDEKDRLMKRDINGESITDDYQVDNYVYKVFGVCFHIGTYKSRGHYISFVRNWEQQRWYYCNDADVKFATVDQILKLFSRKDAHCYSVWYHRTKSA
jgi:hypothetical protein